MSPPQTPPSPAAASPVKSGAAFRTIREVSEALDVPQHVLRFWETRFTQVRPLKRGGKRRYYRPEDVDLLRGICVLLHDDGYTIKGVQKVLREQGQRAVVAAGQGGQRTEDAVASAASPASAAAPAAAASETAPAPASHDVQARQLLQDALQGILEELEDIHAALCAPCSGKTPPSAAAGKKKDTPA